MQIPNRNILKYLRFDINMYDEVSEKITRELDYYPIEIVFLWVQESIKAGNKGDINVLENNIIAGVVSGGFNWGNTSQGSIFWNSLLTQRELDFAHRYIQDLKANGIPYEKIEENSSYNILPSVLLRKLKENYYYRNLNEGIENAPDDIMSGLLGFEVSMRSIRNIDINYILTLMYKLANDIKVPAILLIEDAEGNKVRRLVTSVCGKECTYKTALGEFKGKIV